MNGGELRPGESAMRVAEFAPWRRRVAAIANLWIAVVIGTFFAIRVFGSHAAERILHSLLAHH